MLISNVIQTKNQCKEITIRLKSVYLRNIENSRTNSKYAFIFKKFYDLIKPLKLKIEAEIELNVNIFRS